MYKGVAGYCLCVTCLETSWMHRWVATHLLGLQYYWALQLAHPRPWERCRWAQHGETLVDLHDCSHGVQSAQEALAQRAQLLLLKVVGEVRRWARMSKPRD